MPPYLHSYFEDSDIDELFAIAKGKRNPGDPEQQHQHFTVRFQDLTVQINHRQAVSFIRALLWEHTPTGKWVPQMVETNQ